MFIVDSHCHLDMLDLTCDDNNMDKVIERAKELGVRYILNVSVSMRDFPAVLAAAEAYPSVSASVGLHPNEQDEIVTMDQLLEFAKSPKVVAIGETGLDYFRSTGDLEWQRERFRMHIRSAKQANLPLIIHTRDAKHDTIEIMREEGAETVSGVMHCFTEDWSMARQALDLGFYISFSGIVTFNNAATIQDVARQVPLDRMLVETDSPYLAPIPKRGKSNEPGYARYTADFIANMRGIEIDELARVTTDNFFQLFNKAVRPHV